MYVFTYLYIVWFFHLVLLIQSQAAKAGIVIEESKQVIRGSPQDKAKELAIAVYHSRKKN
ncbi:hypothetical protein H6G96_27605 [Nostoc sp. FACHB-892]|uniref:hypothetical protein n=1 Tax=Nostoc sp. FACHB-892 TaxID=2692843 RepID=UPI0016885D13|nr:hypothetical protein [Nostoc sp. FACHB-892]MBD2729984.1 hypothetical protein [Nostoc sp. FACHB-892]